MQYFTGVFLVERKEIGEYFGVHYTQEQKARLPYFSTIHCSSVSRIVAAGKNKIMQNERPGPMPSCTPHLYLSAKNYS